MYIFKRITYILAFEQPLSCHLFKNMPSLYHLLSHQNMTDVMPILSLKNIKHLDIKHNVFLLSSLKKKKKNEENIL